MARTTAAAVLALASQPGMVDGLGTRMTANPVRKVVNLLQAMQKKVEAEGENAEELYKKYMCYCKTSGSDLSASIEAAEAKIPELAAGIEAAQSKKKQLDSDLKGHKTDRQAAKGAMAEATGIREKERAAYDKEYAESKANLKAVRKATAAIEEGMGGSFLQTPTAGVLRKLLNSRSGVNDADRQELLSFLSGTQSSEYAPASGEIVGILKQMGDEMQSDLDELVSTEKEAVKSYDSVIGAKKKEVAALTKSIETKMAKVGELGVQIVTMKDDAGDTADSLVDDKKFIQDLKKNCAEKTGLHEEEQKMRAQEVVALADTIKILNEDDALELFKKTLPSASASFLQLQRTSASVRSEAQALLAAARGRAHGGRHHLDFILLAMSGKKVGFDKIVKLIDNLVSTLKKEQGDDDDKMEYCRQQFDDYGDKKTGLKRTISDLGTAIEESKEGIATLADEIKALKASVIALDKQIAEATEQRKEEAAEFKELMQSNTAAKELLLLAKNRMNKFYNPKLYKAPSKKESFVQSSEDEAPPPPPATAAAYKKKGEESNGVIAMMDLLVADLDKEMTVAKTEEKNAQAEYEETVADAGDKRRQDAKSLTDKEAAKADLESTLETSVKEQKAASQDLKGVEKYLTSLHGECDWLMKYYKVRKAARADEIDALGKAKAVLSGADYSF